MSRNFIHLIRIDIDEQAVYLFNSQLNDIKSLTLLMFLSMCERGAKVANQDKATKLLQGEASYRYFIRRLIDRDKMERSPINDPNTVEIVSRYGFNEADYINGETYTFLIGSRKDHQLEIHTINSDALPAVIEYACFSGTAYEEAKEEFYNSQDFEDELDTLSMFGEENEIVSFYQEDEPAVYRYNPLGYNTMSQEVLIPEGTNITSLQADDDFFGKSVIAPYSLFKLDMQLNTVLDTLDLTNAGIRNVNFSIRGNQTLNQFGIKRLYLPKIADTIYSICSVDILHIPTTGGSPMNRCRMNKNPKIPVAVFVPKSVKHICDRAIIAHIVVFERGIQLESLGNKAISARLLVMSDDPRLENLIELEASQNPDKYNSYGEKQLLEFELNLGNSLKSVKSSPVLVDDAGYLYTKFHLKVPSNDLESLALLLKFSSLQRLRKMFPEGDWQGKLAEI